MTRLVVTLAGVGTVVDGAGGEHVRVDRHEVATVVSGVGSAHRPTGEAWLDDRPLHGLSVAARVRRGVVSIVDAPVAADVSVRDHLAARVSRDDAERALVTCPVLRGRGADPAGVLSGGERLALAWLRAVVLRPRVVVLQDASVGLDAETAGWAATLVDTWVRAPSPALILSVDTRRR